jgi:hypothetical protein
LFRRVELLPSVRYRKNDREIVDPGIFILGRRDGRFHSSVDDHPSQSVLDHDDVLGDLADRPSSFRGTEVQLGIGQSRELFDEIVSCVVRILQREFTVLFREGHRAFGGWCLTRDLETRE